MATTDYYELVEKPRLERQRMEDEVRRELGVPPKWAADSEKIAFYRRQIALLEKADAAPRCGHVRTDGTRCRAPRLKQGKLCYAHERMEQARPKRLQMAPMEDANAVMMNLMEVQRALVDGQISEKTAGLLLYSIQIAAWNVQSVTFAETDAREMVRDEPAESRGIAKANVHHGDTETRRKRGTAAVARKRNSSPRQCIDRSAARRAGRRRDSRKCIDPSTARLPGGRRFAQDDKRGNRSRPRG